MRSPRLYLGTMTFAWSGQTSSFVDDRVALEMVQRFLALENNNNADENNNAHYIDTARIYAGGKTETMVGKVLNKIATKKAYKDAQLRIGTKAHPSQPGGLSPTGIQQQLDQSLAEMTILQNSASDTTTTICCLDEYYLHQPDTEHSLLESLQYLNELCDQGTIRTIGMSNYHVSEMKRVFQDMPDLKHKPKVYQGLYNPLNRLVESELLPLLKQYNCSFVAYNPLAAGLLVDGKYSSPDDVPTKGRFKNNQNYLPRFYTPINFQARQLIQTACEKAGITMVEATYQWLLCHSALSENDGILLGASSLEQLDQNIHACQRAVTSAAQPLDDAVLKAFDDAWDLIQNENNNKDAAGAFPYWRSYSSDMPNRERLDQGASYEAKKK